MFYVIFCVYYSLQYKAAIRGARPPGVPLLDALTHDINTAVSDAVAKAHRELQELSQTELAELTKIPQSTISAIENNRINLGVERAKVVATALQVHPSVLVFPGWEVKDRRLHNKRILRAAPRP